MLIAAEGVLLTGIYYAIDKMLSIKDTTKQLTLHAIQDKLQQRNYFIGETDCTTHPG